MKTVAPLFREDFSSLLREAHDWPTLAGRIQNVPLAAHERIHVQLIGSERPLLDLLREKAAVGPALKLLADHPSFISCRYAREAGRIRRRRSASEFAVVQPGETNTCAVVFAGSGRLYRHGVQHFLDNLYPRVVQPFITQSELEQLVISLQRQIAPTSIRITEECSKARLGQASRRRFSAHREWTDRDIKTAFDRARAGHYWFRSLLLEFTHSDSGRPTGTRWRLSKNCHFAVAGNAWLLDSVLVQPTIPLATDRVRFFSNRSRTAVHNYATRAMRIQYSTRVFAQPAQCRRLVDALRRFRHGSCTVLHGNPYVHVSVVDCLDYSSTDVWVTSNDQILLVPQLRASAAALTRVVSHIFEHFGEGVLSDTETSTVAPRSV